MSSPAGFARTTVAQLRTWSTLQWRVAGVGFLVSFLVMGIIGETLPVASIGRGTPVEWWSYVTLILTPVLIGLITATFVPAGQPKTSRRGGAAGAGLGGVVGTVAMACPVCNPLAIPLFGTAGGTVLPGAGTRPDSSALCGSARDNAGTSTANRPDIRAHHCT